MKYIVFLTVLIATPAMAQMSMDDGIRQPQSMMVGGETVIDDGPIEVTVPEGTSDEDIEALEEGMEDANIVAPIAPSSPSAPRPEQPPKRVKQVIKPMSNVKVQRSIADDRIDDGYVQEMVKDNFLFTPNYKDKKIIP